MKRKRNILQMSKLPIALFIAMMTVMGVQGQVRVDFKQRTSTYSPDKKIYNIKGDFEMIGNTNMTLQNYTQEGNNSSQMKYVDVDNDPNTVNSSSATLQFSTENDAVPECSNIVYAGLYWTGRAHDGGSSPIEFTVGGTNNRTNGDSFNGYSLSISAANYSTSPVNGEDGRVATYTFTPQGGGDAVIFRFYSWSITTGNWWNSTTTWYAHVTVQVGSGTPTTIPGILSNTETNNYNFNFSSPFEINTGAVPVYVNSLRKRRTDNQIQSGNNAVRFSASVTTPSKTLNKRKVKLKKAGDTYQTITASANDIYYPSNTDGNMYSAYAEVTDYVKEHGAGEYFVADIALNEGEGGGTGFYGGWGMIVVYENSKMKWRDVTIFDGHAYVAGSTTVSHQLEISGFNTAQNGDINMKLGLIAGEGDTGISGDYFQILPHDKLTNPSDNDWVSLSHDGNSTNNFFNGSIVPYSTTNPTRNPNLKNNTGLDIAMFNIDNSNNSIITNNQTSTKFRYGSTQDTYIISTIAMAVDAYVPEVESLNVIESVNVVAIDNSSFDYTVKPGDEVTFKLDIKNRGTEAVKDLKLNIPVPFSGIYKISSATYNSSYYGPTQDIKQPVHDQGFPGSIDWEVGDLPKTVNPDDVLATITFTIKITTDCAILTNINCNTFTLTGTTSGEGVTSGTKFTSDRFVTGYESEGVCVGEPDYTPISLTIDADDWTEGNCNLDPDYYKRSFEFCDISEIPLTGVNGIRPQFPNGTRYFSDVQFYILDEDNNNAEEIIDKSEVVDYDMVYVRGTGTEYGTASTTPFPLKIDEGPQTYFAIAPGLFTTCYWEFTIDVKKYCGNFWIGSDDPIIGTQWNLETNWTAQTIPAEGEDIEFATVANNNNKPAKNHLRLDTVRTIGNLINKSNKKLVVTTGNQLIVQGEVTDNNQSGGTIIIESKPDEATGTLIFKNTSANANVDATVQFYNKAYTCNDCGPAKQQWQYFGIPVESSAFPYSSENPETIFEWSESAFGNKWIAPTTTPLTAFRGYEINSSANETPTNVYDFVGKLNVGDKEVAISKSPDVNYSGRNLIGNSYTAAIPIRPTNADDAAFTLEDGAGWDGNVYLFNTGSRNEWRKLTGSTVNGVEGGRYRSVPANVSGEADLPDRIPSMHAFMINATSSGNLKIDYSKLVKNKEVDGVAWRSASTKPTAMPYIVMEVVGSQSADKVWMFENITATRSMQAGWDGVKMSEGGITELYVKGDDDNKFQVATVPQLQGTTLGIKPDNNDNFTISFAVSPEVESRNLHLRDLVTGRAYAIRNGVEYNIAGIATENENRFRIISLAAGEEVKQWASETIIDVFVVDHSVGVVNNSDENCIATLYDFTGKVISKQPVERATTALLNGSGKLQGGVYMVKVNGKTVNETKRVLVR